MPEQDRIAGKERRHDRVDGGEIRVVPGSDREHDAERFAANEPVEPRLRFDSDIRKRACSAIPIMLQRAILEAADLPRLRDRPPHLTRNLLRQRVPLRNERVHGLRNEGHAFDQRNVFPLALGFRRGVKPVEPEPNQREVDRRVIDGEYVTRLLMIGLSGSETA